MIGRDKPRSAEPRGPRTQASDTAPDVERRQIEAWRRMEPWEKLRVVEQLVRASEELARVGIEQRHPHAGEHEIELRLAALRLDRETMTARFGWDPLREGY